MGKKSKAPAIDPRIGDAAMLSAQTGQDYLAYMKNQAAVSNGWATEDRTRHKSVFEPLEDAYIAKAKTWASPENMAARVNMAASGVQQQIDSANAQRERSLAAMGVDPRSGRALAGGRSIAVQEGLAKAGAINNERRAVRAEADVREANAINLGAGGQVNPATSLGLSNSAASGGFGGAMGGYGQQGNLLQAQYDARMRTYQANQDQNNSLMGGIGSIIGLAFPSDKKIKTDIKKPGRSLLKAVEKMPVEEWSYKDGQGDGQRHVGTYAQDFKKQTGHGDGRSINVIDAIGTTMGAIKELSAKVDKIAKGRSVMQEAA